MSPNVSATCAAFIRMSAILVLGLLAMLSTRSGTTVEAIVAYDCTAPNVNFSRVALHDVAPCVEKKPDDTKNVTVQVIQTKKYVKVEVMTCLVKVSSNVYRCGMFSHVSTVQNGHAQYVYELGAEGCRQLSATKSVRIYGTLFDNLKAGATNVHSVTLAGSVDSNGKCEGGSYASHGMTYDRVVVEASLDIFFTSYQATVDTEENEVKLRSGLTCPYNKGFCMDVLVGETVWVAEPLSNCDKHSYDVLYEGVAKMVSYSSSQDSTKTKYVMVKMDKSLFALRLGHATSVCQGINALHTEHPALMVIQKGDLGFYFEKSKQRLAENVDLVSYINTKFAFSEVSTKADIQKIYDHSMYQRCLLERDILRTTIALARSSQEGVKQLLKDKPGYTGIIAGDIMYVGQCLLVSVDYRQASACFNELPVKYNNESWFLTPVTRVLTKYGTEIKCNSLAPPTFLVEPGVWIAVSPTPHQVEQPEMMSTRKEDEMKFTPLKEIGESGLYPESEMRDLQKSLLFNNEREAVAQIITSRVTGRNVGDQGFDATLMFSPEHLENMARSTISKMWSWLTDFGLFTSTILGLYTGYRIVQYFVGVFFNALAIYNKMGFGPAIAASLHNASTTWAIGRHDKKQASRKAKDDGSSGDDSDDDDEDVEKGKSTKMPLRHV